MKNRSMQSIEIRLSPSLLLMGMLLVISMIACIAVIIVVMPFAIKLCLLVSIIFSTIYYILRDALRILPVSWQQVSVTSYGELRLVNQCGQQIQPQLHASSFIHPWLVILKVADENASWWSNIWLAPVIIFPSEAAQHRQLRVWLRWWKHDAGQASATSS